MDIGPNASATPHGPAEIVRRVLEEGWSRKAVARAFGVCAETVEKWTTRFMTEEPDGLRDRSSRPSFTHIHPGEKATSAVTHLRAAVAWHQSLGVTVRRVMTDNGSCYRAFAFRDTCRELGLKHIRTRPYTPRTNGKAERFIQTSLREWAYAKTYDTSEQRAADLPVWTHRYNWHRPPGRNTLVRLWWNRKAIPPKSWIHLSSKV